MKKVKLHYLLFALILILVTLGFTGCVAPPATHPVTEPTPQPAAPDAIYAPSDPGAKLVLDWHREGGIAGFCDDVAIFSSGEVLFGSCTPARPADIGKARLSAAQLDTLNAWVNTFQSFNQEVNDEATADAMTIRIQFIGEGRQQAQPADFAQMSEFAQNLWNEVQMANQPVPTVCLTPDENEKLLVNDANAYCLLYPANYTPIEISPSSTVLVIGDLMNHTDPRVEITVEAADRRSLEDIAAGYLAAYTFPEGEFELEYLTVDGIEAVMLDNLPGQDLNRRVALMQNGRVYSFFFAPLGDEGTDTRLQSEALYQQTLDSFRFMEETIPMPLPRPEAADVLPSDVQYIQALVDVHIRSGPGANYGIVGDVFAGQFALVTGIMPDGAWYRVICPDDTIGSCFVAFDPTLIQPATPPNAPESDTGEAVIEQVELVSINDATVTIALYGSLPDACSQIDNAETTRAGTTFYIQMTTSRMANARCASQATPFVQEVVLDMTGLPSGNYQVVAGSVSNVVGWEAPDS